MRYRQKSDFEFCSPKQFFGSDGTRDMTKLTSKMDSTHKTVVVTWYLQRETMVASQGERLLQKTRGFKKSEKPPSSALGYKRATSSFLCINLVTQVSISHSRLNSGSSSELARQRSGFHRSLMRFVCLAISSVSISTLIQIRFHTQSNMSLSIPARAHPFPLKFFELKAQEQPRMKKKG